MHSEHARYYGSGMDTLVIVCSWNTNVIMVCAECSGNRMRSEHKRYHGLGMDTLVPHALGARTLLWFGQECTSNRMHSEDNNLKLLTPNRKPKLSAKEIHLP